MRVGTLFSGVGAPEMAMRSLGNHQMVFACDNDAAVKKTYLMNHECGEFFDDVSVLKDLPEVDLLIFGFPCQPFSLAGKGLGLKDRRGQLVLKVISLMRKNPPQWFVAENVEGLTKMDGGRTLKLLLKKFRSMGYNVKFDVVNALDCGVPHNRRRLWIVGCLDGDYQFPIFNEYHPSLVSVLDRNVDDVYWATDDFLSKPKVQRKMMEYNKDYINCITQTICRNGSSGEYISYVAAVNRAIGQARKPTEEECCRLFGFPSDFHFPSDVCMTKRYAMLANSMVVPVLNKILKKIVV